ALAAHDLHLAPGHAESAGEELDQRAVGLAVDRRRGDRDLEPAVLHRADARARGARLDQDVQQERLALLPQVHTPPRGPSPPPPLPPSPSPRPSWRERRVAASTALMRVVRRPPCSRVWRPAMAVPPGEVTMSLSWPG